MNREYVRVAKKDCYRLEQLIGAAVSAGEAMGATVSIAEATDTLVSVYSRGNPCEMLYDGSWSGLAEPYSEKFAPRIGVDLENKMIDAVNLLYNDRWWDKSRQVNSERLEECLHLCVLKEDGEAIWKRMWSMLFNGDPAVLKQFTSQDPIRYGEDKSGSSSPSLGVGSKFKGDAPEISGQTFGRLQRAIASFPSRYPDYQAKSPKLDDDVRVWLKQIGLAENDAERRVFGAIIREHFKLSPDTQKIQ